MPEEPQLLAPSVASALRILELLAEIASAGLSEIALRLGLNKSTCFNILAALIHFGVVVKLPGAKYRLGPRLIELGAAARTKLSYRDTLRAHLGEIVDDFGVGAAVGQALEDGLRYVVVDRIPGPDGNDIAPAVGSTFPLTAPALGRALLAKLDNLDALEIVRRCEAKRHGFDETGWKERLLSIRKAGFATSHEEFKRGVNAVAAAVTLPGEPAIVIGLIGRSRVLPTKRLLEAGNRMVALARRLEHVLLPNGELSDTQQPRRQRSPRRLARA